MKKIICMSALLFICAATFAQTTIEFTYDAAGNRLQRNVIIPPPFVGNIDDQASQIKANPQDELSTKVDPTNINNTISLFPNPTRNHVNINIGNIYNPVITQSIELVDLNGIVIKAMEIESAESTLRLNGNRNGMYYVFFKEEGIIKGSWKVIKVD